MSPPHLLTIPNEVRENILEYSIECSDAHLHPGDPAPLTTSDAAAQKEIKRWSFFFEHPKCDISRRQDHRSLCEHLERKLGEAGDIDEELLGCQHIVKQPLLWTCEQLRAEFVQVLGKQTNLRVCLYIGHKHRDLADAPRSLPAGVQDHIRKIELDISDLDPERCKPVLTMDFFWNFRQLQIVIINTGTMRLEQYSGQDHGYWNEDGLEPWLLLVMKEQVTKCKEKFASEVPGRKFKIGILLQLLGRLEIPSYYSTYGYTLVCCEV